MDLRLIRVLSALSLLLASQTLGCGSDRFIVVGTAKAPSTSGFIELKGKSGGQNPSVRFLVHMEQLHLASELDPSLKSYVVWLDYGSGPLERAGSLRYNPNDRTGELSTQAHALKFVVRITAEANDTPGAPSDFIVASQELKLDD